MKTRFGTKGADGFTLLEVMIALVIVSLGMMAVTTQINNYTVTSGYVEEKTLASWIATNVITELSIQQTWPELDESEREVEFAGRNWHVRVVVSETEADNLRRVDVEVARAETPEQVLQTVSGLIEPPPPRGFSPARWNLPASGGAE